MPETGPDTSDQPTGERPNDHVWRRIGRDLVRPSRSQLVVAAILLLLGFAVTLQLSGNRDQRYTTLRQDELVAMLDDVQAEARPLEGEVAQLESSRDRLPSGAASRAVVNSLAFGPSTWPCSPTGEEITESQTTPSFAMSFCRPCMVALP